MTKKRAAVPSDVHRQRLLAIQAKLAEQKIEITEAPIEEVELSPIEQRELHLLRAHIDTMVDHGWRIISREPITLKRGAQTCFVQQGMLISPDLGSSKTG
ncbi:hypothetical protein [Halopseudomonas salegens]|uniref:Uncharacterized protein n=1 Tax=Halopseudomonas salegens TaxID=1434072 RepID=A0A1H2H2Y7_9GAMM|nr:hypothetical protein [Halopseudomonas salegens]SDU26227.1 hypothetical protein SAMN05216210_2737 [Halopseudomonas salegens]